MRRSRGRRGAGGERGRQRESAPRGGASICEHNCIRSTCKDCGGASICEHNCQEQVQVLVRGRRHLRA